MYSKNVHTTAAITKSANGVEIYFPKVNIIRTEQKPYIGQYGPIKKPLLTNFLSFNKNTQTSINHPQNE